MQTAPSPSDLAQPNANPLPEPVYGQEQGQDPWQGYGYGPQGNKGFDKWHKEKYGTTVAGAGFGRKKFVSFDKVPTERPTSVTPQRENSFLPALASYLHLIGNDIHLFHVEAS